MKSASELYSGARGSIPATLKKACADSQIEITSTLTLKTTRFNVLMLGTNQNEMISASSEAVTAPTEGPNQSVAAKTKGSETEIRATMPGTFTVKEPVNTVRVARSNQAGDGGWKTRSRIAQTSTHTPAAGMALKYVRAALSN